MPSSGRYLHFDNIDMTEPVISARCCRCQRRFAMNPKTGEKVEDVLLRVRAEFNAHECQAQVFAHSKKPA
jgi:hypothetical protein